VCVRVCVCVCVSLSLSFLPFSRCVAIVRAVVMDRRGREHRLQTMLRLGRGKSEVHTARGGNIHSSPTDRPKLKTQFKDNFS